MCLSLVKHCVLMYATLPSFHDITRPLKALLTEHLAAGSHPCELQVRTLPGQHSVRLGCFHAGEQGVAFLPLGLWPGHQRHHLCKLEAQMGNRVTMVRD